MTGFEGRIGHLEGIESPWGNAGGVVKTLEDVNKMARTGVGWIEDGSQTIEARLGNAVDPEQPQLGTARNVYTHNPTTGETTNSLGMPGKGITVWAPEIAEKVQIAEAYGKKFVQNVAPVTSDPAAESVELVETAYSQGAHAVLLNAGCPNVITADGGRHELLSRDPLALTKVLVALQKTVEQYAPIFIRISPQVSYFDLKDIISVIIDSGVASAVFTPNTWPGHVPLDANDQPVLEVAGGAGGLSGPATAARSQLQTFWAVEELKGSNIDVVSSSGITTADELKRRLHLGAVAGAGTTFFYEPANGWQEDTNRFLAELVG